MQPRTQARRLHGVLGAALVASVVLLYAPVVGFDFVAFDDPVHVTANAEVRAGLTGAGLRSAFGGLHAGYWIPLTWTSHMIDVELFGLEAAGHHATNVLIHALNTLLLFLLLTRWTGAPWRSAFAAALFALHPLRVESVAWITERKDVLSTFFGLLSLAAYAGFARRRGRGLGALAACCLALSLMAKPMLVTLPAVFLLLDFWPLERLRRVSDLRPLLLEKLPFVALVLGFAAVTLVAQLDAVAQSDVGPRAEAVVPPLLRLANACVSAVRYLGLFFWPTGLAVFYPHPYLPGGEPWAVWQVFASVLLLAALTALALGAARTRPAIALGWLWYLVTLVPVLGLVQTGEQAMADRFTYVPMIGPSIAIAWLAGEALLRLRSTRARVVVGAALALAVLLPGFLASRAQLAHWRDTDHLYRRALRVAAPNPLIHTYYGHWLHRRGRVDEAIDQHEAASRVPDYAAVGSMNLAEIERARGRLEAATRHYQASVSLVSDYAPTQERLGTALVERGLDYEAEGHLARAVELAPYSVSARVALARLHAESTDPRVRRPARAFELATQAVQLDGKRHAEPLEALGSALEAKGNRNKARAAFKSALERAEAAEDRETADRIRGRLKGLEGPARPRRSSAVEPARSTRRRSC